MFEVVEIGGVKTTATKAACNHCYCVDVSGSMSYDLPKIRQHLKNIISVVAQPSDTFTIIWFSGRGQCGVVFENMLVSDLSTVQAMHTAIDRWLKPVGATGFIDPINLAKTIAFDVSKVNNFVFLSDGYDNQSNRSQILDRVQELKSVFQSIAFIEYGYYADRELMAKMAESVGGLHIFAEGYEQYENAFSSVVSGVARVNNINVNINKKAKHAMYLYNNHIHIVPVVDGVASVPEDVSKVHSIVPKDVLSKQLSDEHVYLILYYASKTENTELVWRCLEQLGDVALVEAYTNAFTKQELSNFEKLVEAAVLDHNNRFLTGKDKSAVPNKNTPTVIDLLKVLSTESAMLVTDEQYWQYNKTGQSRVTTNELPKFKKSLINQSTPLHGLVFNSERPNISIMTTTSGRVELPENDFGLISVPSFITRNYTIIRDGIKNIKKLPVIINKSVFDAELKKFTHEVIEQIDDSVFVLFDLSKSPVVNRAEVETVNADDMIAEISKISELEVKIKVIKFLMDLKLTANPKTAKMTDEYGAEAAAWLSSIGVRDYGFSPVGTTGADVSDEYEAIQVIYKIAGMSNIPAIGACIKKAEEIESAKKSGKPSKKTLNIPETLVMSAYDMYNGNNSEQLTGLRDSLTKEKRAYEQQLAKYVFSLILGRKWFADEDTVVYPITVGGLSSNVTLTKQRTTIKM